MALWRRPTGGRPDAQNKEGRGSDTNLSDASSTEYIGEVGGNDAPTTYQDASGAPVESVSPLGYSVGPVTILFLNISMMIGTGIYSTRK